MLRILVIVFLFSSLALSQINTMSTQSNRMDKINKLNKNILAINDEQKKNFIHDRIMDHHQKVVSLIKQGKSDREIINILKPKMNPDGVAGIEGTVLDEGGALLSDVIIMTIYNEYGLWAGSTMTDQLTGYYGFYNLLPGKYYVETECYHYYKNEFYNDSPDWQHAELVTVNDNAITENINFFLDHYRGAISGKVQNSNGEAITDCIITVISREAEEYNNIARGHVDSTGFYCFTGVPTGKVNVEADYRGDDNYISEWFDNAKEFKDAATIELTEGDTTKNIDFTFEKGSSISGTISFPGAEFRNYDFMLILLNLDGDYINYTYPDTAGFFILKGLLPGEYKFEYEYDGEENFIGGYYANASSFETATIITVPEQSNVNLDVTYTRGAAISGIIKDESGNLYNRSMIADLVDDKGEWYWRSTRLSDSIYYITQLPSGKYKLVFSPSDYLDTWYNNKLSEEEADWITVDVPDTTTNINITLKNGCSVSGKVFDPSGNCIFGGYGVIIYDTNQEVIGSSYSSDSVYNIRGIPPGKYKLLVAYYGDENFSDQWYGNKIEFELGEEIILNEGDNLKDINFALNYSGTILGLVRSENFLSGDSRFQINLFNNSTGNYLQYEISNFNGGFLLNLPYGSFKISVISNNENDSLAVTYAGGGGKFSDSLSKVITINSGDPVIENIVMKKVDGSIEGKVLALPDSTELKAEEINLTIYDEDGYLVKEGYFPNTTYYRINGIRPGKYYIYFNIWLNENESVHSWYNNLIQENIALFPKINIPEGASSVTVNSGTSEANFYYVLTNVIADKIINPTYNLAQNFPNPFNPLTRINYELKEESFSSITIYNSLGQIVKVLDEGIHSAGRHYAVFDASSLSSGIYLYRLSAKGASEKNNYNEVKKMILLK